MISEAISCLKDRTGSSHPAIAKCIEEKYKTNLPPNFKRMLSVQLKKFVLSGKLMKIKNSYKISVLEKPAKKTSLDSKETKETGKGVKRGVGEGDVKEKKGKKMKRLSQVSTPSALKKKKKKKALMSPKKLPKSIKSPKPASKKRNV
ncbi:hypothetical protein ACLOJK_026348 [Asimina triloba]